MASSRREYLLQPANQAFIAFTMGAGFVLNLLPWGRSPWVPDFLAMVLVFWCIHQPRRIGIGIAFLLGLLMDIHEGSLLGEHALGYSLLSYGAIALHRRVPWFGPLGRMLHIVPLLAVPRLVVMLVREVIDGATPGGEWFVPVFTSALLWPVAEHLLLAPQRRARERDDNRPL